MKKLFVIIALCVSPYIVNAANSKKVAFNLTEIKDKHVSHSIAYIDEVNKDGSKCFIFRLYEDGKEIINKMYYGDNIRLIKQRESENTLYILQDDNFVYAIIYKMYDGGCTLDIVPDDFE